MRSCRVAAVALLSVVLITACGPPPSDPGPVEPTEPPVAPRMLLAPVGATGLAAITEVRGMSGDENGLYISTATAHRKLDIAGDLDDRTALLVTLGSSDPSTGRNVRVLGGPELPQLAMCDSAADDADCTPVPGHDGFGSPGFSPDGTKLAIWKLGSETDPVHRLRLIDSTTFETIVELAAERAQAGTGAAVWSPDSSEVALALDGGLARLAATAGAEPVVVTPEAHGVPGAPRQIGAVLGWTPAGRILSIWSVVEWPKFPDFDQVVESVQPDGSSLVDRGVVDPNGWGAMAPDGSVVLPLRSGQVGWGSVPTAIFDRDGSEPMALSSTWTVTGDDHREAQVSLYGFTADSAF